jgi:hypothetical protein
MAAIARIIAILFCFITGDCDTHGTNAHASPVPPGIIGVTEGSLYTGLVKPTWPEADGMTTHAALSRNNGPPASYAKGTPITENGNYRLTVQAVNDVHTVTAETTIRFRIDAAAPQAIILTNHHTKGAEIEIIYTKQTYYKFPLFSIWAEDCAGNFMQNVYVSSVPATNIMRYNGGWRARPQALPCWSHKACTAKQYRIAKKPGDGREDAAGDLDTLHLASFESPSGLDAVSGATPAGNFRIVTRVQAPGGPERKIKLFFEINQAYDTGWFFTAGYSDDKYYATNGEPSLVYAAEIDFDTPQAEYVFELAGYGHYAGRDGKLHTELTAPDAASGTARSKFDHAAKMVHSIKARIK